jgi:hypothetical protein
MQGGQPHDLEVRVMPKHVAHFYDSQCFPANEIADYFLAGLQVGEGSFLIATPDHFYQIKMSLQRCGVDADGLVHDGLLRCEDAEAAIEMYMGNNDLTTKALIDSAVGRAMGLAMVNSPAGTIRVAGEGANLLTARGDYQRCIQVEQVWDQLATEQCLQIYCAYSNDNFCKDTSARHLCDVCDSHSEVAEVDGEFARESWARRLKEKSRALKIAIEDRKITADTLHKVEASCADMLETITSLRNERLGPFLTEKPWEGPPHSAKKHKMVDMTLTVGLREVLQACEDACCRRRSAPRGSAEWHKSTGEILAYGRLTYTLEKLRACLGAPSSRQLNEE